MIYFVWYLALGLVCIFGFAGAHIWKAESQGYDAINWWNEYSDSFDLTIDANFVIGIFLWPLKIYEFITFTEPRLYELYDLKEE